MTTYDRRYRTPRWALYSLLLFTPLARGSVQPWAVTLIHIVTLIAAAAYLAERFLEGARGMTRTCLDVPILFMLAVVALASVFSLNPRSSAEASLLLLNYVAIFYLVVHTVRYRSQVRALVHVIVGVATFLAVFGFIKKFGTNPFPWWNYTDTNLYYEHLQSASTYVNPNHFSAYLAMVIPLALGMLVTGYRDGRRWLMVFIAAMLAAALVFALSRGGWLSAGVGIAFMAAAQMANPGYRSRKLLLAWLGGAVLVCLVVLGSTQTVRELATLKGSREDEGLYSRKAAWKEVIRMIGDRPLLGTGPGTFVHVFTRYQPPGFAVNMRRAHNDYLQFAAESGVLAAVVMAWMGTAIYRRGFRKLRDPSRLVRGVALGALSGVTALLVHSFFDFNLQIPANALLFTVLCALVVSPVPVDNRVTGRDDG